MLLGNPRFRWIGEGEISCAYIHFWMRVIMAPDLVHILHSAETPHRLATKQNLRHVHSLLQRKETQGRNSSCAENSGFMNPCTSAIHIATALEQVAETHCMLGPFEGVVTTRYCVLAALDSAEKSPPDSSSK